MKSAGPLFISGVKGLSLTDEEKKWLTDERIGGVILFSHNYESVAQLIELINSIQQCRDEFPLLITLDHEGGRVMRFRTAFTQFPSMQFVAKKNSPKLTFEVHEAMGHELKAVGINLSFSPVCDLLTQTQNKVIGDRAFGDDPAVVEKHVSAAIRGLLTQEILSCAKHFPGHGDTIKDSHFHLPWVKTDLATLESREWIPFLRAAKSRVPVMMMAHLMVDALDNIYPTSLSEKSYQKLRSFCKFDGVIVTDDMEMKAIDEAMERIQARDDGEEVLPASVQALKAGSDMVIYRSFERARLELEKVNRAIKEKKLSLLQIEEKIKRVEAIRKSLGEYRPKNVLDDSKKIPYEGSLELMAKLGS